MTNLLLSRRLALLGGIAALSGCSAVTALNSATRPLDTYDLAPAGGAGTGPRSRKTVLIVLPEAPAAISSDRIVVRPTPSEITYLPDARLSDALPEVLRSLLIRSISATGRIGYVGRTDGGPVPDSVVLTRIDAFEIAVAGEGAFTATVDLALTLLNDRDQSVIATRRFGQTATFSSDTPEAIVAALQGLLDALLPAMADWVIANA